MKSPSMILIFWTLLEFGEVEVDGTGGVKMRNSSVPIRQLIQQSRLSELLLNRNSTDLRDECTVCEPIICNGRISLETDDLYCMRRIDEETESEIEECVSESELHDNIKNETYFEEKEGCETNHTSELCWCLVPRPHSLGARKTKSRMRKIQNVVHEKRRSMLDNSAPKVISLGFITSILSAFFLCLRIDTFAYNIQ